ncbi:MAG: 50S ribosomal protein L29 [Acidobacteriaceae bacterium]
MELDKIRNLSVDELKHEEQQASEQLFRLRFQMRLGQTEGVKKLRGIKKDIARIKTIGRERELGLNTALHVQSGEAAPAKLKKTAPKKAKKAAPKKVAKKTAGKKIAAKKVSKKTTKKKEAR